MKSYELRATSHPKIKRVVNRKGDWDTYLLEPENAYLRSATAILSRGYAKPGLLEWAKNHSADEADEILRAAGDRGDAVHQAIAMILSGKTVDRKTKVLAENNQDYRDLTDSEWDCLLSFDRFWIAHQPKLLTSEATVANVTAGYAGTLDAIVRITKSCGARCCNCADFVGALVLVDWKTSGGIHANYGAQVAAYCLALPAMTPYLKAPYPRVDKTAIIRLGTNHKTTGGYQCEFYDTPDTQIHYSEFLAAKTIDDATYRPFDPEKEIMQIPEVLKLKIEREEEPKKPRKPRARKAAKPTKKVA